MAICRDDRRAVGVSGIGVPPPDAWHATVVLALGSQRDLPAASGAGGPAARSRPPLAHSAAGPPAAVARRPAGLRASLDLPGDIGVVPDGTCVRIVWQHRVPVRGCSLGHGAGPGVAVFSVAGDEGPYRCGAREGDLRGGQGGGGEPSGLCGVPS